MLPTTKASGLILLASLLCLEGTVFARPAQVGSPQELQASCRQFVGSFYDWYVPLALKEDLGVPSSDIALRQRKSAFSEELYRALTEDSEARARSKDMIVGLDGDPFLNSQDPWKRYGVGRITVEGNTCRAKVFGFEDGKPRPHPDVIPELKYADGRWTFVDFYFREDRKTFSLLAILKDLADSRRKAPK